MSSKFKNVIVSWYKERPIDRPLCVTFTVKQQLKYQTPKGDVIERITKTKL